jgi:three-Cys-motif partner protein
MRQKFGGSWTEDKLSRVQRYLCAWTKVMMNQPYSTVYIDAFAGTGYRELQSEDRPGELMMPELAEEEPQRFIDGSVRNALQVDPGFDRYVFVDLDPAKAAELDALKLQFPVRASSIKVITEDANRYLQKLCARPIWDKHRAVLFLDPFGMEVHWDTITAIAKTQAIDLWYLFPLGANRVLRRDGNISESHRAKLTALLGSAGWEQVFYQRRSVQNLFGEEDELVYKCGSYPELTKFFVQRLEEVFPGVAQNPLTLCNSRGTPLFLLCFAVSNPSPRARTAALKIAEHILGMRL